MSHLGGTARPTAAATRVCRYHASCLRPEAMTVLLCHQQMNVAAYASAELASSPPKFSSVIFERPCANSWWSLNEAVLVSKADARSEAEIATCTRIRIWLAVTNITLADMEVSGC